jgi:PqqA peptide cyclase
MRKPGDMAPTRDGDRLTPGPSLPKRQGKGSSDLPPPPAVPLPFAMLAEITHRCPLHCVYCSNPLGLTRPQDELSTSDWLRVFGEARVLGVVQLHLSGGEPLVRPDLETLVRRARELDFYTNLITSGAGLTPERARALAAAGLDNAQLSLQAAVPELNNALGGRRSFEEKARAAKAIREAGMAFSMNVVLHRHNLEEVEEIIDLCASWGCERLELANTQYHGWALLNRGKLLPTREQLRRAEAACLRKKETLRDKMEIIWVLSDYYEPFPKPCMGGWGQIHMTVCPNGTVLPCPGASVIKSLRFESARDRNLSWIWRESAAFNAFRGFEWMPEPCRKCDRRFQDFGGCRCQAFALTGDAVRTDPVCQWAPDHHLVEAALAEANQQEAQPGTLASDVAQKDELAQLTYRQLRAGF